MINQDGISISDGIAIKWEDLSAISGHKICAGNKTLTYLVFDHGCGEYFEIMNEDEIFQSVVENLHKYIELSTDWFDRLDKATPDDGVIELWKYPGG